MSSLVRCFLCVLKPRRGATAGGRRELEGSSAFVKEDARYADWSVPSAHGAVISGGVGG